MNLDEPVWDVTVFTKNRDRLLDGDVARDFLCEVVNQAREQNLTSDEHFTVDGTLIEAWASLKSFQCKDQKNPPPALRANIDETLTAAIITEQGGKENHRERSQDCCSFCSQFA
jgi:hypothetical protein